MYTHFKLAIKYFRYYLTAANGKGHGIHSPFVYEFVEKLLNDKKKYTCYKSIENRRKELLNDNTVIEVEDFGAGSSVIKTNRRVVRKIAASSLKPKKYAQLLFRMVQHYKPATIVELGTSFGITSAYLASGNESAQLFTCEGAKNIAAIAQQTFSNTGLKNIELLQGDFALTLPLLLQRAGIIHLAFIDGNHQHRPTVQYFEQLLAHSGDETIFIFDDIHWSAGMEAAWKEIMAHDKVTLTIDLFFIGIVCVNPGVKVKQHFTIRF
ncbi:MAG: class I SAM-dependent methyltransferase [Ferruginibacter sp.]